jgi:hypothetical protein
MAGEILITGFSRFWHPLVGHCSQGLANNHTHAYKYPT